MNHPLVDLAREGLDAQAFNRAAGVVLSALGAGPAVPSPRLYRVLHRLGVLARDPASWPDATAIADLPWGARRVQAPAPEIPPGVDGPWPQAPRLPGFYPAVLNTTDDDRREHFALNAARYLGQIVQLTPAASWRALRGPRLLPMTDADFVRALCATSLGQFVRSGVEPAEREAFAAVLREKPSADWATVDLAFCPEEHLLPGLYAAPTVTLLEREAGDTYRVVAIRVGGRVLRPGDGSAWELARYFVLQGAQIRIVSSAHPRLHFGVDAVNAVTRSALPEDHPIRQLLAPHLRFTLGLHEAVIHHRRSPIHNSQREVYTPFPYGTDGMHALVAAGRDGVPGREAWPAYRFDDGLFGDHVPYGRYRREWFETVHAFVREALAGWEPDGAARAWADHIAPWVPGFPAGEDLARDGNLARALARFVCAVSVFHTGDHHSYAGIPLEWMPFRLRAAPPDRVPPPGVLDLGALVSPEDYYRHRLSHAMFYRPVILHPLRRVRYRFDEPARRAAAARFARAMDELDARWAGSGFPASGTIGTSLQY